MPMIWPETAMALVRARTGIAPEAGAALGAKLLEGGAAGEYSTRMGCWIILFFRACF